PDGRDATADPHVTRAGCGGRLLESRVDSAGDESELGSARHRERWAWMMGEHENRSVIGRLFSPPASPALVRPWAANRTEHVSPEDPRADPGHALLRDLVVDAGLAIALTVHASPDAGMEEPLHQLRAVHAEWMVEIL